MAALFPIFLKLEGRKCLVIGAGRIAEQKISGLLSSGAVVCVVAPEAAASVQALASQGRLGWEARKFAPSDLDEAVLVIAATGDRTLNGEIFRLASERGVLCNAVDEPENCNFYYPAVVRRGDLQIAISTNGKSPALAQRLKSELEEQFSASYASWLEWLGNFRARLFRKQIDCRKRTRILHRAAGRERFERYSVQLRKEKQG